MKKKTIRAGVRKPKRRDIPTAANAARESRRPVLEQWATLNYNGYGRMKPSICLWGDQESAFEGLDFDEVVCLVRVEVLEVLDEDE